MKKMRLTSRVMGFAASELCFRLIVGLLVVQALWIALTAAYPMAFDEDFHLGVIRLYAHHLSPFWSTHPANADAFGAIARDPSYLYHYLMSFPYRAISSFTGNQSVQVILLRFINIGLFASCLPLFRRLLLISKAPKALVHASLLVFVLVPIVPLLAGQINYDNLFIPLTALVLVLTLQFVEELSAYKRINTKKLMQLISLCLLASLVKYAFLPVFLVVGLFVCFRLFAVYRKRRQFWASLGFGVTLMGRYARWWLLLLLLLSAGLFWQRIGVNIVRYHNPVPDCAQVLTIQQCSAYGPWIRDYNFAQSKDTDIPRSANGYTRDWVRAMWLRSYFAVDGPRTQFQTRAAFGVPAKTGLYLACAGAVILVLFARKIWRRYDHAALWLFTVVPITYIAILWLNAYRSFLATGQPVGINGRYLLPVLPLVLLCLALAFMQLFRGRPRLGLASLALTLVCLAWGGGALTYILRSNDSWYWDNAAVRTANHAVQRAVGPAVPGYDMPSAPAYMP